MLWSVRRSALLATALFAILVCGACGYQFGSNAPVVLPEGHRTLAIKKVVNPTVETWIEPVLRAKLRDEITSRGQISWTDPDTADATITLKVLRFTEEASVKDERDKTLKYRVELQVEGVMNNKEDHTPLWESGLITKEWFYQNDTDRPDAEQKVVILAIRELVNRMGDNF